MNDSKGHKIYLSLIKKVLFSLFPVLLLLLLGEVILRFSGYAPKDYPTIFRLKVCGEILGQFDENLFWKLPGRSPNAEPSWQDAALRIICLTDSVSVMYRGQGYPDILRTCLRRKFPHENVAVFNAGVPGYTSHQGLKWFESELAGFRPTVLSICFGWNDYYQSGNGLPDKLQNPNNYIRILKLSRYSSLITFLLSQGRLLKETDPNPIGPDKNRRVPLKNYRANILAIVKQCRAQGIYVILMTAPYLNEKMSVDLVKTHEAYNNVVREIVRNTRTPLIDLVSRFGSSPRLFINPKKDACHYNWQGAAIVANSLCNVIIANLEAIKVHAHSSESKTDAL